MTVIRRKVLDPKNFFSTVDYSGDDDQ